MTAAEHHRESRNQRESATQRPEARVLALVVSAHPEIQQSLRSTLRTQGHSIVCATELQRARAVLRQASPDVVIADLGADLAALLPHIAANTAIIELSDAAEGPAGRARMVLPRDFDPDQVLDAVERIRHSSRLARSLAEVTEIRAAELGVRRR
jgi:DNA-binding response OmpR family regulator